MKFKTNFKHQTRVTLVIGGGYVGLPLALLAAKNGKKVVIYDKSEKKCKQLAKGVSGISENLDNELKKYIRSNSLSISNNIDANEGVNFGEIIICVPTPITEEKLPDLSLVSAAMKSAVSVMSPETLIILESSTYPGTTRGLALPQIRDKFPNIEDSGVLLAYSPERIDPGNKSWTNENTPRIVSGFNERSISLASNFYKKLSVPVVEVDSLEIAEAAKLFENSFRLVNIALVNEFANTLRRLNIDPQKVLSAAYTKPFGIMPFKTSAGIGGHCIPVDPYYLTWWSSERGEKLGIIEAAQRANEEMPKQVLLRIRNEIRIDLAGMKILLVGVTYKTGVPDARETPATGIWKQLQEAGAELRWWDPLLSEWESKKRFEITDFVPELILKLTSIDLPQEFKFSARVIDLNY